MEKPGVYRAINDRIRKKREEWERARVESPETTCSVYMGDCATMVRYALKQCSCSECMGFEKRETTWLGKAVTERCTKMICPCAAREQRANEKAELKRTVERAVSMFGVLPSHLAREMTFETYVDNPDWRKDESDCAYRAYLLCKQYADRPEEMPFLVIYGNYGAGKTHLAMAIAQRTGLRALWANCNELFSYLKTRFGVDFDAEIARIRTAEMLVLDDLGANRGTPWENEKLYEIVNHRHQERLPTVITTNLNPYAADSPIDGRLLSRMLDLSCGWPLHLNIRDNRRMLPRREYRQWPE